MIYLASPYSHPDKEVVLQRVTSVCLAAGHFMRQGRNIISPIAHCHAIAMKCELPTDYKYWRAYNHALIDICQEYWILLLTGWQESEGITGETEYADSIQRMIRYVDPLTYEVNTDPRVSIRF